MSALFDNGRPIGQQQQQGLSASDESAFGETDTGGQMSAAQETEERDTVTEGYTGDNDQFKLVASTAPVLADGNIKARFQCPLKTCARHLDEMATLGDLWAHCASEDHALALYHQCHYRCEFDCLLGFPDTLSRFEHCGGQRCGVG